MEDSFNEVVVAVIVATVLGVAGYLVVKLRTIGEDLTGLARYVLPHFEPSRDEHGREHYDHTLPARVDTLGAEMSGLASETKQLRVDLVDHMKAEEELRVNDQAHQAMREARYDQLIEQLRAGNPEVRQ